MEGQTQHLFAADSEMMEFELWEGQQKLSLDLIESKAVMILKSKRRDANPPVPWTNADTLALFMNDHALNVHECSQTRSCSETWGILVFPPT